VKTSRGARTIVYPTPVFVVGTYSAEGGPNIMAAAWGGIASSRPPAVSVALRAATLTHGNILARGAFTISIASEDYVEAVDFVGIVSGRDADKFAQAGLTPVRSELVDAPYVEEFPMVLECALRHTLELGLHTLFIGEILDVKAEENVLDEEGKIAIDRVRPLVFAPDGGGYFGIGSHLGPAFEIGRRIKDRPQ
jgi:flavin reductase (DIM6/NTAB) family NADH-FMN oxidoreductase RutF